MDGDPILGGGRRRDKPPFPPQMIGSGQFHQGKGKGRGKGKGGVARTRRRVSGRGPHRPLPVHHPRLRAYPSTHAHVLGEPWTGRQRPAKPCTPIHVLPQWHSVGGGVQRHSFAPGTEAHRPAVPSAIVHVVLQGHSGGGFLRQRHWVVPATTSQVPGAPSSVMQVAPHGHGFGGPWHSHTFEVALGRHSPTCPFASVHVVPQGHGFGGVLHSQIFESLVG